MARFNIGELEITRVEDFVDPHVPPKFLCPDLPDDVIANNLDWLAPNFYDEARRKIAIHMQSWVIKTKHHTILVDTCAGNHKPRPHFPVMSMRDGPYLENLREAGVAPEAVDIVMCTHLHIDHVGWNTRLENGRWVPTFPNARYLFSQKDFDAFDPRGLPQDQRGDPIFEDSVLPVVDAGLAQMVDGKLAIDDNLVIEPSPGHSPGHQLLRASSGGVTGLFTGDIVHHPVQIAAPECNSFACADAGAARATRKRVLEECAECNHLLVPAHFAAPHFGRVVRKGTGLRFSPGA